jgi:ribosome maturation protein SDO1
VFLSVSKAQTAPSAELAKAFGTGTPREEILQEILRKGEVQVGERERKDILERVEKEVLDIVSGRLVDPSTKRVYTTGMIHKALDQLTSASGQQQTQASGETNGDGEEKPSQPKKPLWTGVSATRSAKSQALDAMKALIAWQPIPVMRARMRLRVTCPVSLLKQSVKSAPSAASNKEKETPSGGSKNNKKGKGSKKSKRDDSDIEAGQSDVEATPKAPSTVKDKILAFIESIESQEVVGGDEWEIVGFAEPGAFKGLTELVSNETRGRGRVEVLDMSVTHED